MIRLWLIAFQNFFVHAFICKWLIFHLKNDIRWYFDIESKNPQTDDKIRYMKISNEKSKQWSNDISRLYIPKKGSHTVNEYLAKSKCYVASHSTLSNFDFNFLKMSFHYQPQLLTLNEIHKWLINRQKVELMNQLFIHHNKNMKYGH